MPAGFIPLVAWNCVVGQDYSAKKPLGDDWKCGTLTLHPLSTMYRTIINYLLALLKLQAADPAQEAEIAALKAEVADLQVKLTASQANDPTPEEQAELDDIIAQLASTPPAN